ncbi:hypothetical protein, partial [Legionella sp.]|uniref:hypothetical protein n=1 Tax=Legionella sp. TaxID=459 RepID=UPI0032201100
LNLIFNTLKTSDKLSEELLIALVKKAQSEQLIRSFLQMDVRWNVLQVILDKIPDYNNLHRALTHENASEEDCQNWLKNLADKQKIMQEEALSTDDPRKRVLTALDALKVKACTHAVKATEDEAYEEVARASITLYRTLRKEIEHYLKTLDNPEEFLTNCLDAIDLSREILSTHRGGAKQLLVDIVSAILALITFKFFRSSSHPWDFFESKTESIQIVEKLQGDIQDIAYSLGINQGEKPLRAEHRAYDLEDQRSPEEHLQPIAHPIGASQKTDPLNTDKQSDHLNGLTSGKITQKSESSPKEDTPYINYEEEAKQDFKPFNAEGRFYNSKEDTPYINHEKEAKQDFKPFNAEGRFYNPSELNLSKNHQYSFFNKKNKENQVEKQKDIATNFILHC